MKNFSTLIFLLFLSHSLVAQSSIGYFEQFEGEKITLYKNAKKAKLSRMDKGCDCQLGRANVLFYANKEGKIVKINQSKVKRLFLEKGTKYCLETYRGMPGGMGIKQGLGMELPESLEFFGLPLKKGGKTKVLQNVTFRSEKYLLTMYTADDLTSTVYIFTADKKEYISGRAKFLEVGYGKEGKKMLTDIKRYFKDCNEFITTIEETLAKNEKVKRFQMTPALQNIQSQSCE